MRRYHLCLGMEARKCPEQGTVSGCKQQGRLCMEAAPGILTMASRTCELKLKRETSALA